MQKIKRFERRCHHTDLCLCVRNFLVGIFRSFNYHYHATTTTVHFNEKIIRWRRGRGRRRCNWWFLSKSENWESECRCTAHCLRKVSLFHAHFSDLKFESICSFSPVKYNMAIKSLEQKLRDTALFAVDLLCSTMEKQFRLHSIEENHIPRAWRAASMALRLLCTISVLASKQNALRWKLICGISVASDGHHFISVFRWIDAQYAYAFMLTASFVTRRRRRRRFNL